MAIDTVSITFDPHPHTPDIAIDHHYRRTWWLPILGPTATVLLDTLYDNHTTNDGPWQIYDATELSQRHGLGTTVSRHSPLIRTLDRLVRFRFGTWDLPPADPDCCLTLWDHAPWVPRHYSRQWPDTMQADHLIAIAHLHDPLRR